MAFFETISGIKHTAYRDAEALLKPKARTESGQFLVEDADTARQALAAGVATAVYALPDVAPSLMDECARLSVPLYVLGSGLMHKLLGTGYETATTVVTIARRKTATPEELLMAADALILCGESIQDPRNVGVLVRTAEAAGCTGLLLSADCAEAWSRQSVRSTTGSIFRVPVAVVNDLPQTLLEMKNRGAQIVATSVRAEALAYDADMSRRPMVLCVGNETKGVTPALRDVAELFVKLPMAAGGASSLNVTVAAGILLYEAARQRSKNLSP